MPELTGRDWLLFAHTVGLFVGNDYIGRGGGAELQQHYTTDHASICDTRLETGLEIYNDDLSKLALKVGDICHF